MLTGSNIYLANVLNYTWMYRLIILSLYPYLIIIIIIITSSDDIQPSTLITDHSPSGLLLDMEYAGLSPYTLL